ncbi:site-specific recombinase XerD [Salinibacter ruber]|uniref:tyrosine-type recombinase/integrase n=1 Tax=Salinibacter TaxID=146918 RepID=UPI00161F63CA|nr:MULTISPECIES: site-specific integrase [Salinibacter]MBB4060039.1 site-specific recombinase XerD [Salinibacter ruber]MCS3934672.1 site-specific recombinase XerD [Salinibacter ruber]MCS4041704.1 site-specific recombinase XerD [Salinibacter ruber]MCS4221419.1 site-specific recombinase XerD [Salinibacter ruber]
MSSLYQKRGIFYYQGKDEDGNRFQKSLRTRDRAEAREKKEKLDERFSTDMPTTLTKLVEDYLEHRRRKRDRDELSERTVGSDEYVLPFFLDWTQEKYGTVFSDEIGEISFSAFKEKRLENVSPTTVGKDLRHIQSFFSHLRRKEVLSKDPLKSVEIPQPRRRQVVPNQQEFQALKKWLDERIKEAEKPKRTHLLMKLACHTGMRLGEMAMMKWRRGPEDVGTGHARNYVYLTPEEQTLTIKFKRKLRVIPVGQIWNIFEELKERREPSDTFVFSSPMTDSHLTVSTLCHNWKDEVKKVDALSRPYTSHSIRHGVVTHLLRQGVPVYKVGKIVGHSSEKITERYSHFIPDDLEDAMNLLG